MRYTCRRWRFLVGCVSWSVAYLGTREPKMPGKSPVYGAVLAGCAAAVLSLVALVPVAIDRVQLNTASLSPELQAWRARGQYYVHIK